MFVLSPTSLYIDDDHVDNVGDDIGYDKGYIGEDENCSDS